jgi:glycosyltransferase involved in cell wall biosynthesis
MKVSGFTIVRNGTKFDYPYLESLRSLLPLVDELIVNVGTGDDDTLELIRKFAETEGAGKVKWFESRWPLDDPEKKKGGLILSEQTNLALEKCTGDWCIYLQADEVIHEADVPVIRKAMETIGMRTGVEGLLFDYVHFYGSFDVVQKSRSAYRREVRAVKLAANPRSVGDAQSFRRADGGKLRVAHVNARIYHYGWVRPPEKMREKTFFMDQLYHGATKTEGKDSAEPHTGDNYRYKKFWGLRKYLGTHPAVMSERIRSKGWRWDLGHSPFEWRISDAKKIVLDSIEKFTGVRLFEYRSYSLVPKRRGFRRRHEVALPPKPVPRTRPRATLIVTTYEMPRHLALVCAGLENQTTDDFEIIFCDDGSGPVTGAVIRDFTARAHVAVKHLWQEDKGFRKCKILNEALRQASGDLVIFLDGDCVPHRHFVEDHLKFQEGGHYLAGRRVELGPRISGWLRPEAVKEGFFDWPGLRMVWSVVSGDSNHLQRCFRLPWQWLREHLGMTRVDDMKGCNYSVSRRDLEAINGFDESYEGYGREDTDVEIRLQNSGLKIKSIKGVALQFHIWHPRREFTEANESRLEEAKKSGRSCCENGLLKKP